MDEVSTGFVDFFGLLERYKHVKGAPKSLHDLPFFEDECRENGKHDLADWVENWRKTLEYYIEREHSDG